jgi:hypothetical protein
MILGLLSCLPLAFLPAAARAGIIFNQEPNNTFPTAQVIPGSAFTKDFDPNVVISNSSQGWDNTSLIYPHVTILRPAQPNSPGNLDFFRFNTIAPGFIAADIITNILTPSYIPTNFDTKMYLFTGDGVLLAENDDSAFLNPPPGHDPNNAIGGYLNSRIETGTLPAGQYVIGVSWSPSEADNNGDIFPTSPFLGGNIPGNDAPPIFPGFPPMFPPPGSYTLVISANTPEPTSIVILGLAVLGLIAFVAWNRRFQATGLILGK